MDRSRIVVGFLLAPILFVLVVSTLGCGGSSELPLVRNFFASSRMRDNVTLANIATTAFDPRTDGQVENLSFVSESAETTETLHLREHAAALKEAIAAEDAFTKKKREYQDANGEGIKRVLDAEAKAKKLTGKDLALQQEWTKWRDETAALAKKVSEAKAQLGKDRPIAELSMQNPQRPVDVTEYDGIIASKDLTISANVRSPDGQTARKTLVVTLKQARLKGKEGDLVGKWIVTNIAAQ